jgi:hypothetical protein
LGFGGALTSAAPEGALGLLGEGAGVLDVVGAGAGVLDVGVEVVVGGALGPVVCSLGVVSVGVVPVPSGSVFQVSAASAPVETGPRPAAVRPPPAIAETSARHAHRRAPKWGVMRRSWSSGGRPMVVVGASSPQTLGYAHRDSYRQRSTKA